MDGLNHALLVGYESFTSKGFALPIYQSTIGANQAFVAEVEGENNIIQFNVYEGRNFKPLKNQTLQVALGSPFIYVFIFEEKQYIGTKAQIWNMIKHNFPLETSVLPQETPLPLTVLDFKNEMSNREFRSAVNNAWGWYFRNLGKDHAINWVLKNNYNDIVFPKPPFKINSPLTKREKEVLTWAGEGKTAEDIASILYLSTATVRAHLDSIISKTNALNTTHAVSIAYRAGLLMRF